MKSKKTEEISAKEPRTKVGASRGSFLKFGGRNALKNKNEGREKAEKKIEKGEPCSKVANGGGYMLAQKMKELEMMDMNDEDHLLDIEEVIHYYSRLTCPAYLDIIDKFFMDMYSEFFLPWPCIKTSSSPQRLRPFKF